jgi:hypothetical protein
MNVNIKQLNAKKFEENKRQSLVFKKIFTCDRRDCPGRYTHTCGTRPRSPASQSSRPYSAHNSRPMTEVTDETALTILAPKTEVTVGTALTILAL